MDEAAKLVSGGNAKGALVIYKTLLDRNPEDSQARFELAKAYLEIGKPDQAEREAKHLIALPNPPERISLLLGKIHVAQAKKDLALQDLAEFLSKDPGSAEAWEYSGHAHALGRDWPQAVSAYTRSLSLNPARTKARIGLVESLLNQGQLSEARMHVQELLAANPDNQIGLHQLATIQNKEGDIPAVIATYGTIAAKYPHDIQAKYTQAVLMLSTNGVSEPVEQAATALLKDFPKQPEGYKLEGMLNLTRGLVPQAVTSFQQALRLRPDIETRYLLAQAYERDGKLEMAASELHVILDNVPRHIGARLMLAGLHLRMNRADETVTELEKLQQIQPDNARLRMMLGDIYLRKKELDKSLALYGSIPEDSEQSSVAHFKKGLILSSRGNAEQAETQLRSAISQAPDRLETRLALAALLKQQMRLDEAVAVLDQPGLDQAQSPQVMSVKAAIRAQQGRLQEAQDLLEAAKQMNPALEAPYHALAKIHLQKGNLDQALEEYRQLLQHKPQEPLANTALAASLEGAGEFDKAQEHLVRAAQSKQVNTSLNLAAFLTRRGKSEEALQVMDQCLKDHPNSLPVLVAKARLHFAMGGETQGLATLEEIESQNQVLAYTERFQFEIGRARWDQAEGVAAKFVKLNPVSANSYLPLASVKEKQGDFAAAEDILRQALNSDPSGTAARLELGALLLRLGRAQEALGCFDEAVARDPNSAPAYAARGMALHDTGDTDAAAKDYEAALRLQANIPLALNNLAMIYAQQPSLAPKALEYAFAANLHSRDNPYLLDTLGYVLMKNNRPQEAVEVLQRAIALAPDNEQIVEHLNLAKQMVQ